MNGTAAVAGCSGLSAGAGFCSSLASRGEERSRCRRAAGGLARRKRSAGLLLVEGENVGARSRTREGNRAKSLSDQISQKPSKGACAIGPSHRSPGDVGGVFPSYRQTRCCGIVACMTSPSVQACERAPEQITTMCRTLASPFSAASSSSPSTVFAEVGQRPSAQPGASPCLRRNKSPSACEKVCESSRFASVSV